MLNIDGGVHIDPGAQQLFNVLIALDMAAALCIGMGQLIYQDELGLAGQSGVQIEFPQGDALVGYDQGRKALQTFHQFHGGGSDMGLNIPGHHVHAHIFHLVGHLQHGIGFPHAGRIAEKDLEPALPDPRFVGVDHSNFFQNFFRSWSMFFQDHLTSRGGSQQETGSSEIPFPQGRPG